MRFLLLFAAICLAQSEISITVLQTEVFAIKIDPGFFNWTYEGRREQFVYEATLGDSPDLPSWIYYTFSPRHHAGFLYGVVPEDTDKELRLDVVGLDRKSYETRVEKIQILIQDKLNIARFEVHMKIVNLNVADMFDSERMDGLKDIFRNNLWKDSQDDLYVTLLQSAVDMGARKPVNPNEEEGVIVRLGSELSFSQELLDLQEEVTPLYKIQSCPRDFKRTSVERFFRDAGFVLDWCSFRLIQKNYSSPIDLSSDVIEDEKNDPLKPTFKRQNVPLRSYKKDMLMTITLPMVLMTILVFALTFVLCFEYDDMRDELSEFFFDKFSRICIVWYNNKRIGLSKQSVIKTQEQSSPQRFLIPRNPTDTLGSLSLDRDRTTSPDPLLLSSPSNTLTRGMDTRPSPPPYVKPKLPKI